MFYVIVLIIGFVLGTWVQRIRHTNQSQSRLLEKSGQLEAKNRDRVQFSRKSHAGCTLRTSTISKGIEHLNSPNKTSHQHVVDKNRKRSEYLKQKYSGNNASSIVLQSTLNESTSDTPRAKKQTRQLEKTPQNHNSNHDESVVVNLTTQTLEQLQLLKLRHVKRKPSETHFINHQNDTTGELAEAKQWRLYLHEIATAIHNKQHQQQNQNKCVMQEHTPKERTPEELKLLQEEILKSNPSKRPWTPKKSDLVDSTQLEGRKGYYR